MDMGQGISSTIKVQLVFSCGLVIFYICAIYVSLEIYREFKGMMEDAIGRDAMNTQNILSYGTI